MKAFPRQPIYYAETKTVDKQDGMDLRDYFAAKAMQSILMSGKWGPKTADELHFSDDYEQVMDTALCLAEGAYQMADAMMFVRKANA